MSGNDERRRLGDRIFRIVSVDLSERYADRISGYLTQALVAIGCFAGLIVVRSMVDLVAPGAAPFALSYPFIIIATVLGRWQAGLATLVLTHAYAWNMVLPPVGSFSLPDMSQAPQVVINALSGCVVVAVGEIYRRAVRRALAEKDRIAEERLLFLREIDHRVKNNFAIFAGLVRMEDRHASSPEVSAALRRLGGQVESIARAHQALYRREDGVSEVSMKPYLESLCASIESGMLRGRNVAVRVEAEALAMPRDRAVSVGLVVNELCTNAAKHAFNGRDAGQVAVTLKRADDGIVVTVEDDGVGLRACAAGSQGQTLLNGFATQAGGRLAHVPTTAGTRFELRLGA